MDSTVGESALLNKVILEVQKRVGATIPEEVLREKARNTLTTMGNCRIKTFVPLLAAREILEDLRQNNLQ